MAAAVHLIVHGRVQGVGYRIFVTHEASERGLRGWVRNRHDGTVETVLIGELAMIDDMVEACRRGPPGSHVDSIDRRPATEADLETAPRDQTFSVLPTV